MISDPTPWEATRQIPLELNIQPSDFMHLGCIWIQDLVIEKEKEKEMEKLEDPTVQDR